MISINMNLVYNLINVIVLFLVLKHFLFQPVLGIMQKREELIQGQLDHAAQTQKQADALKKQYESSLETAKEDSQKIIDTARINAKAEYDRIVKEADEKANRIVQEAHKATQTDKEKTMKDMGSQIANLALVAAAKIMSENQEQTSARAYSQFIKNTGESR